MAENKNKTAKRRRGPGNRFKPGQSGNPGGRPKLSAAEKHLRSLSREQFAEVWNLILGKSKEELERVLAQPGLSLYMEKSITFAINMTYSEWDRMHDRMIGKVPDDVAISFPKPTVIEKRDGGQVILGHEGGDDGDE